MPDQIDVYALIAELRMWGERLEGMPARAANALSALKAEQERLYAAVWAADRLGVAVQKWTDYRDRYGSGDGIQELRVKDTLTKYWSVTGGSPEARGLNAANPTPKTERDVAQAERDTIRAELERARAGLAAVEALIDESRGVDGLHRNGDLATWDELRTGGRYEEWLRDFDAALSPTAPVTGEKEPPGAVLDRAQASLALVEAVINSGRSEEWLRNFETALIAAAKARSTADA